MNYTLILKRRKNPLSIFLWPIFLQTLDKLTYAVTELPDAKAIYWAFCHYMHESTTCMDFWGT